MKIHLSLILIFLASHFGFSQSEEDSTLYKYRFNKVYPYDQDTIKPKQYHVNGLISNAKKYIGIAYLPSGKDPKGFDCSGFLFYIHKEYGVYLPYFSSLYHEIGKEVNKLHAKKGDLIMFKGHDLNTSITGHVGLVVSELGKPIQFIHSSSHKGVIINFLDSTPYFNSRFIGIRSIID